jgi:hypothetical protein
MENIAVFIPMPRASVRIAIVVKPGERSRDRRACFIGKK